MKVNFVMTDDEHDSEIFLKRREFFSLGVKKVAKISTDLVKATNNLRAQNWIRPPFSQPEDGFLLHCTKCSDCITACPHTVLFRLPAHLGSRIEGTPAMDLLNHGCHMCHDWPCVTACETGALAYPEADEEASDENGNDGDAEKPAVLPMKFAQVEINQNTCLPYSGPECSACRQACPVPGAMIWEGGLRPVVDNAVCTGCALCRESCIMDPKAIDISSFVPEEVVTEAL